LLRGVEAQTWGLAGSELKTFALNWQVVRMPLWTMSAEFYYLAQAVWYIRNVAIEYLGKGDVTVVAKYVKALRLDRGRVHGLPLQVISRELGIGSLFSLCSDRLDGRGAVDGLLSAGDIGQSIAVSIFCVKLSRVHRLMVGVFEKDLRDGGSFLTVAWPS
jgi:hypothetical protein